MQQKQQKQQQLQQQPQQLQGHFGNFFEKVQTHVAQAYLAFSKVRPSRGGLSMHARMHAGLGNQFFVMLLEELDEFS